MAPMITNTRSSHRRTKETNARQRRANNAIHEQQSIPTGILIPSNTMHQQLPSGICLTNDSNPEKKEGQVEGMHLTSNVRILGGKSGGRKSTGVMANEDNT